MRRFVMKKQIVAIAKKNKKICVNATLMLVFILFISLSFPQLSLASAQGKNNQNPIMTLVIDAANSFIHLFAAPQNQSQSKISVSHSVSPIPEEAIGLKNI